MKENVNLATTTSITSTFTGERANDYVAAALLSANTIEQGAITVIPNQKFQYTLNKGVTSSLLKNATCDFDAAGSITLTEKTLTVKHLNVNLQVCKNDYITQWDAASMGYSDHDTLPKSFTDFLLGHVIGQVAAEMESLIWTGDATVAGEIGGIVTELALDAELPAAQEGVTTAVTVANVVATCLQATINAIPNRLYGNAGLSLYCANNVVKAYIGSQGGNLAAGVGAQGTDNKGNMWYNNGSLSFNGIPIIMINGLPDNHVIATTKENLVFVNTVASDLSDVRVIDMSEMDGSDNVRVIMKMGAVASYKFAADCVTYGFANGAN